MTQHRNPAPIAGPAQQVLAQLRRFTPARIALGRAGNGMPTAASLRFLLDHARARDAVHSALDFDAMKHELQARGWKVARVHSACADRGEYLRRPDLGRRLAPASRAALDGWAKDCDVKGYDVAIVVADGLSAMAVKRNLLPVLDHLGPLLRAAHRSHGPLVLAEQARVAIGDEIGETLDARLVVVLIGERPGLSAANSLSSYMTWQPRAGTMDSARNCISNIRGAGLQPSGAAHQIAELVEAAFVFAATGVRLSDLRLAGTRALARGNDCPGS